MNENFNRKGLPRNKTTFEDHFSSVLLCCSLSDFLLSSCRFNSPNVYVQTHWVQPWNDPNWIQQSNRNIFICCSEFIHVTPHVCSRQPSSGVNVYERFDFCVFSDSQLESEGIHDHILCARCQLGLQITQEAHLSVFTSLTWIHKGFRFHHE